MVPVTEPSEDTKPLPILAHMPSNIKMEIGGNLDYFDKNALRNVNKEFQRTIQSPKVHGSVCITQYSISKEVVVSFTCYQLHLCKTKKYTMNGRGWLVKSSYSSSHNMQEISTVQKGENLAELIAQDLNSVMEIKDFTMALLDVQEMDKTENVKPRLLIMPRLRDGMLRLRDVLSGLKSQLKVQTLRISNKSDDILAILPHLDTDLLTELTIGSKDRTRNAPYSIDCLELHRFPNLNSLTLRNTVNILPVEAWWNIREVFLEVNSECSPAESLAQLPRIIQHLRQSPTLYECNLNIHSTDSEIKNAIGDMVQWETFGRNELFNLPADGPNLELNASMSSGGIMFIRTKFKRR